MLVKINGQVSELPESLTLEDLVVNRGLKKNLVIIELNGQVFPKNQWDSTRLKKDDSLEIIQIIGGG
jgi:sulfur carrier protein